MSIRTDFEIAFFAMFCQSHTCMHIYICERSNWNNPEKTFKNVHLLANAITPVVTLFLFWLRHYYANKYQLNCNLCYAFYYFRFQRENENYYFLNGLRDRNAVYYEKQHIYIYIYIHVPNIIYLEWKGSFMFKNFIYFLRSLCAYRPLTSSGNTETRRRFFFFENYCRANIDFGELLVYQIRKSFMTSST